MALQNPELEPAAAFAATTRLPFPSAIPGAGIASMEDSRAGMIRAPLLRCPSIYPDLRYRLVLLHERCAYLDGGLLLREFETQSPAAGGRIWLGDDVRDLGLLRRHGAVQPLRIDRFQPVPDHIQHEYRGAIASRADAGSGKSRQRGRFQGVRSPVQAIGVGVLALGLQCRLGLPKACNVVVDFFLGRDFDQLDRTFAPVADRLRP